MTKLLNQEKKHDFIRFEHVFWHVKHLLIRKSLKGFVYRRKQVKHLYLKQNIAF